MLAEMQVLQPVIDATVAWGLADRTAIVALFVSPLAFGLGYCFPVGMRLVGHRSDALTAWMRAVNGACGVMASILAVMISMWVGSHTNLVIAAVRCCTHCWRCRCGSCGRKCWLDRRTSERQQGEHAALSSSG